MSFLHLCEQMKCINYNGESDASIQVKEVERDCQNEEFSAFNTIIFLLKGKISYFWGSYVDCSMSEEQFLYLPANYKFSYKAEAQSVLLLLRIRQKIQFCDHYRLEDLAFNFKDNRYGTILQIEPKTPFLLPTNENLRDYVTHLVECVKSGFRCEGFFSLKIRELFYLLSAFYQKDDLSRFFKKALSYDSNFSHHVIQNSHKYQSLTDLADSMNMTVSGIEKRFKKVFGTSGYKWMTEQRVKKIFHAICSSDSNFKEISEDFGFSSKSTLNDFCKRHMGKTPGEIRRSFSHPESLKNK